MYRWLRDHWHGFEHYRVEWAKSQGLFERDIKKQMAITQEKQG